MPASDRAAAADRSVRAAARPRPQYGEAAAERIRLGVAHYREQVARLALEPAAIVAITDQFAQALEPVGAATSSRRCAASPRAPSVALRRRRAPQCAHGDAQARQRRSRPRRREEPDGCTGLVALPRPPRTAAHPRAELGLEAGMRRDRRRPARSRRDDGPDILTFTEAGGARALRLQRRRHLDHRQLSRERPRLPPARRPARPHPPQGAGAAAPRARRARRLHDAEIRLQQHDRRAGRRLAHRLRMRAG